MLKLSKKQEKIVGHPDIQKVEMKEYDLTSLVNNSEEFYHGAVFVLQEFHEGEEYLYIYVTVDGQFTSLQLGGNNKETWLYTQAYESYYSLSLNLRLAKDKFFFIGFLPKDHDALID